MDGLYALRNLFFIFIFCSSRTEYVKVEKYFILTNLEKSKALYGSLLFAIKFIILLFLLQTIHYHKYEVAKRARLSHTKRPFDVHEKQANPRQKTYSIHSPFTVKSQIRYLLFFFKNFTDV